MVRPEHKSETGRMEHILKNTFAYGDVIVTKYLGGYCEARLGSAMSWSANSEKELLDRIDQAGYGPDQESW